MSDEPEDRTASQTRRWWRAEPLSDEEFIERTRAQLHRRDRYRRLIAGFFGSLALVLLVTVTQLVGRLANFGGLVANRGPIIAGLAFGGLLGFAFGMCAHGIFQGLSLILSDRRAERLLIAYYDAFQQVEDGDRAATGQTTSAGEPED